MNYSQFISMTNHINSVNPTTSKVNGEAPIKPSNHIPRDLRPDTSNIPELETIKLQFESLAKAQKVQTPAVKVEDKTQVARQSFQEVQKAVEKKSVAAEKAIAVETPVTAQKNVTKSASHFSQQVEMKRKDPSLAVQDNETFYLDTQNLNNIKYNKDSDEALLQVAQQFEALFIQEMFKRMRSATQVLGDKDNPLSRNSESMFQDMLDNQMAVSLSKGTISKGAMSKGTDGRGSSFGLADMLYQQLSSNLAMKK
ncbi:MAG: rod-binding protein [Vibrio sp.]